MTFEIAYTGQDRANVETLGIQVGELTLNNLQPDQLTLRLLAAHDDAPKIAANDMVEVWKDDVRIMKGRARTPRLVSSGPVDFQTQVIMGTLWELANCHYFKEAEILNIDVPLPATFAVCWDYLRNWVETYAPTVVTMPPYADTSLAGGELLYFATTQGVLNQPFTSNLAALMINYPKAAVAFDYTTDPPTMLVRHEETAVEYAHGAPVLKDRDLGQNDVLPEAVAIRVRYDWRVYFPDEEDMPQTTVDALGQFTKSSIYDKYPADHSGVGPAVVTLFYGEGTATLLPAGAAQYIFNVLNDPYWQGTMTLADGCSNTLKPGDRINITGSYSGLATMNAVVQSVMKNFDPEVLETQITVGVSDRVTGDTAMERLVTWLRRSPSSYGVPLLAYLGEP